MLCMCKVHTSYHFRLEIPLWSYIDAVTVQVCDDGLPDRSSVCCQRIMLTIFFKSMVSQMYKLGLDLKIFQSVVRAR